MSAYRVSKADMEASRLVFVMLKDCKPMRKVAIPVMDGMSFQAFEAQVRAKLRVSSIGSMTLATTGEQVTSLSQVQDIDQIVVEQALSTGPSGAATGASTSAFAVESSGLMRHRSGVDDADPDSKYGKRKNGGWLSSLLPSEKSSTMLPVTRRDHDGPGPSGSMRRTRRRRGAANMRNIAGGLLLLLMILVLSMFYLRAMRESAAHTELENGSLHHAQKVAKERAQQRLQDVQNAAKQLTSPPSPPVEQDALEAQHEQQHKPILSPNLSPPNLPPAVRAPQRRRSPRPSPPQTR